MRGICHISLSFPTAQWSQIHYINLYLLILLLFCLYLKYFFTSISPPQPTFFFLSHNISGSAHWHTFSTPWMVVVLHAPIPASPAFPNFNSAFTRYCKILSKLTAKLFAWKLTLLVIMAEAGLTGKPGKLQLVCDVQQLEIKDFIYCVVPGNFRIKQKYHGDVAGSHLSYL